MLDIEIQFSDQEIAARLGLAAADLAADRLDAALEELAEAGLERTLATVAVLTRNLAAEMVSSHGLELARAILQRTILEAQQAAGNG